MASQQQTSQCLLDTLYCEEIGCFRTCFEGDDEAESYYNDNNNPEQPPLSQEQDLCWEDEELSSLISKEKEQYSEVLKHVGGATADRREEAVEWILKVVSHYSFNALTAVLAVNYLDRFLHSFEFERDKPWIIQLAAVSCLSLAAKVEETQVPLLLDLQVEESKYVFEAKTIQRMEILVLSSLEWKMNPVTPLSFLDYITRRLGLKNNLCLEFIKRCECLLLCFIADCRFRCYLPSVIATATMLHVINSVEPCIGIQYKTQLLGILGMNKGKVEDCCKQIQELTCRGYGRHFNKRKFGSVPGSPSGVMDLSFSPDNSNDSWAIDLQPSVSSWPEPKKSRVHQEP